MGLEQITDMAERAALRVLSQYREDPKFMELVRQIGGSPQSLEDQIIALRDILSLDTATDVWLEYLAAIAGEVRDGVSDAALLRYTRARILANRSSGTVNQLIEIIEQGFNVSGAVVYDRESHHAAIRFDLNEGVGFVDYTDRKRVFSIVKKARPAGVKVMLNTSDSFGKTFSFSSSDEPQPVIDTPTGFGDADNPAVGGFFAGGYIA